MELLVAGEARFSALELEVNLKLRMLEGPDCLPKSGTVLDEQILYRIWSAVRQRWIHFDSAGEQTNLEEGHPIWNSLGVP